MGIYDQYTAPDVTVPRSYDRSEIPQFSGTASASYWIARWSLRFYVLAICAAVTALVFTPEHPMLAQAVRLAHDWTLPLCAAIHGVGLVLGCIGLFRPSHEKDRAIWGIFLHCFAPSCLFLLSIGLAAN